MFSMKSNDVILSLSMLQTINTSPQTTTCNVRQVDHRLDHEGAIKVMHIPLGVMTSRSHHHEIDFLRMQVRIISLSRRSLKNPLKQIQYNELGSKIQLSLINR